MVFYLLESCSQPHPAPAFGLAVVPENRILTERSIEMIACFKKCLCRKSILAFMLSIMLGTMTLTSAQGRSAASDLNTKVAQIDIDKANLDDVVRVFGEPKRYCWGNEETGEIELINKDNLPSQQFYIADYGDGFRIFMLNGRIAELRFEGGAEYLHQGKLQIGDSLDYVLKVLGEPKETVVGASRKMIADRDGVLLRDIEGRQGYDYYLRKDKNIRMFFLNDKITALYVIGSGFLNSPEDSRMTKAAVAAAARLIDLVPQLDIDNAQLRDIIHLFGNPARYIWGEQIIAPEDLLKWNAYVIDYGGGFHVFMVKGRVMELRFEHNSQYVHQGKLRLGDSIDDALIVMGAPRETVVGEKLTFRKGVLYRDIDGQNGYGYYHRADQRLRLFFAGDKITAIYITRSDYRE
jgi:hypothetical protein